ncbi:MAG: PAS domain S-box protein [Verrucomicrobiota bacterium]
MKPSSKKKPATTRRKAAAQLHQSEERYLALFDRSLDCVYLNDFAGNFLDANQSALDLLGYQRKDIASLNFAALLTEDQLQLAFQVTEEVKATGRQKHPAEFRIRAKDGRLVDVQVQSSLIYKDGKPFAVQGIARDISERKLKEESAARLAAIVESSDDAIISKDLNGLITSWNRGAEKIFGYPAGEMVGRSILRLIPAEQHAEELEILEKIRRGETVRAFETVRLTRDGRRLNVSVTASPIKDAAGKIIGASKVARDITAQIMAGEKVRVSEARLRTWFEMPLSGIAITSPGKGWLQVNDLLCEMLGYTREELYGLTWAQLTHPDDLPENDARFERVLRGESEGYSMEKRFRRKNGEYLTTDLTVRCARLADGKMDYIVALIQDITERKRVEMDLKATREMASQKSALLKSILESPQNVVIFSLDANYCYTEFTQAHQKTIRQIWGVEIAVGMNLLEIISDAGDRAKAKANFDRVLRGESFLLVEEYGDPSRQRTYYEDRYSPIFGNGGAVLGITVFVIDITERMQAEKMLIRSERLLRETQEMAKIGYYVNNLVTGLWESSPSLDRLFGIGADFVRDTEGWGSLMHPDDRERTVNYFLRIIAERKPFRMDYRIIRPSDGELRWMAGYGDFEFDETGKPVRLVGCIQDITERKQMEEALRETEERFRSYVEQAADAIFVHDFAGRLLEVNQQACTSLGYGREELLCLTVMEVDVDFTLASAQALWKQLAAGQTGTFQSRQRRKDGSVFPVEIRFGCFEVMGEKRFLGLVRDITERKLAEEKIRKSQADFRGYFENSSIGNCVTSMAKGWVEVNERLCLMLGYTKQELAQLTWEQLTHPDDLAADVELFNQVVAGNRDGYELDKRFIRKDGSVLYTTLNVACQRRPDGAVEYFLSSLLDITERRRAEESNARLATAVEQAAEAILITDTAAKILYVNPAFERITGYTQAEVIGQNPRLLQSGRQDAAFYRQMWETVNAGQIWTGHFINRRKDGTLYEEDATISPIRDASGKIINFVAVKHDVTHQMELEGQLSQSQKMEAMGTLAGGIAHDFNNILNIIFGYSNLLQMDLAGKPDELEKLREILKAGERAKELVQQILTFSRRRKPERQVIHLNTVVKETTKLLRASLPANILIETDLAADAPAVLADATQLYQVIMNLGTNALHAMDKQASGRLKIALDAFKADAAFHQAHPELRATGYARLTVADNGCGMDAGTLARIYDPFFTTKPVGKGTGLGMAVVHGIIKAHDGVITVESQPGRGTTFRIYLPEQIQDLFQDGAAEDFVPCGQGQKILMVDDEVVLVGMYQRLFKALKYEGMIVTDPEAAVELVRKNPAQFDLVITDLTMPGMSGLEVARQIREIRADMPVILATGFQGTVTDRQLTDSGICEVVEKPMSMATLAMVLHGILGKV